MIGDHYYRVEGDVLILDWFLGGVLFMGNNGAITRFWATYCYFLLVLKQRLLVVELFQTSCCMLLDFDISCSDGG